jgi:hypothetical protein
MEGRPEEVGELMGKRTADVAYLTRYGKSLEEAIDNREHADYMCYMALRKVKPFLTAEKPYGPIPDEVMEEVEDALNARERSNDRFLRIIAGSPKELDLCPEERVIA